MTAYKHVIQVILASKIQSAFMRINTHVKIILPCHYTSAVDEYTMIIFYEMIMTGLCYPLSGNCNKVYQISARLYWAMYLRNRKNCWQTHTLSTKGGFLHEVFQNESYLMKTHDWCYLIVAQLPFIVKSSSYNCVFNSYHIELYKGVLKSVLPSHSKDLPYCWMTSLCCPVGPSHGYVTVFHCVIWRQFTLCFSHMGF